MKSRILRWLLLSLLALAAATSCVGCTNLGYYAQSIRGHLSLMHQREPIDELLENGELDNARQEQLLAAQEIREFATRQLGLPDNESYRSYVQLDRDYVAWNVVATPAFSLKPLEWCFPIAGCVSYRGYFSLESAEAFAAELNQQGYDVAVNPVPAYSTLGWFDDPILSSMIHRGELLLAENIFHELAHQQLYVKDDSVFNEAFASAVGEQGVFHWLNQMKRSEDLLRYQRYLERKDEFFDLLKWTSGHLQLLYQEKLPVEEMQTKKLALFAELKDRYLLQKQHWGGYQGYDGWFSRNLNNARLASIAVYRDRVPDFVRWLEACQGDMSEFYATMKQLSKHDKHRRQERLQGLADCSS